MAGDLKEPAMSTAQFYVAIFIASVMFGVTAKLLWQIANKRE
jgi:hypothetical protein